MRQSVTPGPWARKLQSEPLPANAQGRVERTLHPHAGLLSSPLDSVTDRSPYFRRGPRPRRTDQPALKGTPSSQGALLERVSSAGKGIPGGRSHHPGRPAPGSARHCWGRPGPGCGQGARPCGSRTGCYQDCLLSAIWNGGLTARTLRRECRNPSAETHCFTI